VTTGTQIGVPLSPAETNTFRIVAAIRALQNPASAPVLQTTIFNVYPSGGDDTAKIQAAINSASAAGRGTVFLQPGLYKTSSVITLAANVDVIGASRDSVLIFPQTNSQKVFSLIYSVLTYTNVVLSDFTIYTGATTGVVGIAQTLTRNVAFRNLVFQGTGAGSIVLDRVQAFLMSDILVEGNPGQGAGGIKLWSSDDSNYGSYGSITNLIGVNIGNGFQTPFLYLRRMVGVMCTNISANDLVIGGTPQDGIIIENDSQGNSFSNILIGASSVGVRVQQGAGIVASPTFNVFSNLGIDQPHTASILHSSGEWNSFDGGALTSSGAVTTITAVQLTGGSSLRINNFTVVGFNGVGGQAIAIGAGVGNSIISENIVNGNTTTITDSGTTNTVIDNLGYNPVGASGPTTVGTSPATITNGASPATYYFLQSATNTATVAQGGHTLGTLSSTTLPLTVDLGPNESVVVTWITTAPTYTVSVH